MVSCSPTALQQTAVTEVELNRRRWTRNHVMLLTNLLMEELWVRILLCARRRHIRFHVVITSIARIYIMYYNTTKPTTYTHRSKKKDAIQAKVYVRYRKEERINDRRSRKTRGQPHSLVDSTEFFTVGEERQSITCSRWFAGKGIHQLDPSCFLSW